VVVTKYFWVFASHSKQISPCIILLRSMQIAVAYTCDQDGSGLGQARANE
jgi:hypothetical protein